MTDLLEFDGLWTTLEQENLEIAAEITRDGGESPGDPRSKVTDRGIVQVFANRAPFPR